MPSQWDSINSVNFRYGSNRCHFRRSSQRSKRRVHHVRCSNPKVVRSFFKVLLKLKARRMNVAELAIGDEAMGFLGAALEAIYP